MKISEITKDDIEYYMTEACAIYAVAFYELYGGEIKIISNISIDQEKFSRKYPLEFTHVAVYKDGLYYDVKGKRKLKNIIDDFSLHEYKIYDITAKYLLKNLMGNSDTKPLYGTRVDINDAKKYITNRSTITENQKFDFDKYKPQLLNYIQRIKSNQENALQDETLFYNIITNKPMVGAAKSININPQVWKNYFSNQPFNSNGVWSQRDFNAQLKDSTNNINFYVTVEKSNDNIIKFIQTLRFLDKALEELSNKSQSRISYKTHTILDSFMDHNDSLKVYYNNPRLKSDIQTTVKKWANNNNVILSNRTHEHGLDTDKSFGERLAKSVNETVTNAIKKYKSYTDEQLFQWIKTYLPEMVKTAKDSRQ